MCRSPDGQGSYDCWTGGWKPDQNGICADGYEPELTGECNTPDEHTYCNYRCCNAPQRRLQAFEAWEKEQPCSQSWDDLWSGAPCAKPDYALKHPIPTGECPGMRFGSDPLIGLDRDVG